MGVANTGNQQITFKYSTPLKADYLNVMFNGVSSEGLCSRPLIDVRDPTLDSVHILIHKFSMVVHPIDDELTAGEDNVEYTNKLVKISTTSDVDLSISKSTVAIGFTYRLVPDGGTGVSNWYGDFIALTAEEVKEKKYIIVATVMYRVTGSGTSATPYYSVSTQGADISDLLLKEEGWDCNRWVSLISPRRLSAEDGYKYNKLELRKHNNLFEGYVNGHVGCVYQGGNDIGSIPVIIPLPEFKSSGSGGTIITDNDWGVIQKNENDTWTYMDYTLVKHNSEGLAFAQQGNSFPIRQTDGGIIAVVNATNPNNNYKDINPHYEYVFSNQLRISPCVREEINMYFSDNGILMIR